jgi:hypothetical protein
MSRHCVERVGVVDLQLGERARQARHVLLEAEGLAEVDGHVFVDAVAEDEAAVEHADLGVAQGGVFAVEVTKRGGQGVGDRVHAGIMVGRAASGSRQGIRCRFACATRRMAGALGFLLIINGFVDSGSSSGLHSK